MKKNISKKSVLLSLLLASSVMASAQTVIPIVPNILSGAVAKTATEAATREVAARSFEEGLRAGGQWYITQSLLVGQEVMLGVNQSEVGSPSYQKYHKCVTLPIF